MALWRASVLACFLDFAQACTGVSLYPCVGQWIFTMSGHPVWQMMLKPMWSEIFREVATRL